jgi:hypothetical protein
VAGYNVYMAESSGGPYTRVNGVLLSPGMGNVWVQGALTNGQPYWFVVTSVDHSLNESTYSVKVEVVPGL